MRRLWIKAAIEHRVVRLEYHDPGLNGDVTVREVRPDHVGGLGPLSHILPSTNRFWAASGPDDAGEPCCFKADDVVGLEITDTDFEPRPDGRWMEHVEEYHRLGLRDVTW
jgi:hypothetical protein